MATETKAWQEQAVAFSQSLRTPELELLCSIDFTKPSLSNEFALKNKEDQLKAWAWQYESQLELIRRLELGLSNTAVDKPKAHKFRLKALGLAKQITALDNQLELARLQSGEKRTRVKARDSYLLKTSYDGIGSTEISQAATGTKTPARLGLSRANRATKEINILRFGSDNQRAVGFMPSWYPYLGLENAIEFIIDIIIIIKTLWTGKASVELDENIKNNLSVGEKRRLANDNKAAGEISWGNRLIELLWKDSRPSRMANAILWVTINVIALPVQLVATVIGSIFTFAGTVIDVFIDAASSLYDFWNHHSLINKLETSFCHSKDPVFKYTSAELQVKREESFITRFVRTINYDVILCSAMGLMTFAPTAWIGAAILLGLTAMAHLNFTATMSLESNRNNDFDKKIAPLLVGILLTATILTALIPLAGLPLSVPLIGAGLAFTVGLTGFARKIFRGWPWVTEKCDEIKGKIQITYSNIKETIKEKISGLFTKQDVPVPVEATVLIQPVVKKTHDIPQKQNLPAPENIAQKKPTPDILPKAHSLVRSREILNEKPLMTRNRSKSDLTRRQLENLTREAQLPTTYEDAMILTSTELSTSSTGPHIPDVKESANLQKLFEPSVHSFFRDPAISSKNKPKKPSKPTNLLSAAAVSFPSIVTVGGSI